MGGCCGSRGLGVMIGIEQFLAADFLAVVAAVMSVWRLAVETYIGGQKRRFGQFAIGVFAILVVVGADFIWTANQEKAAEIRASQLGELKKIPSLQNTIDTMGIGQKKTAEEQARVQARLEQKIADIGVDNQRLKKSIEQKDATLEKIATAQYELNFFPQVMVFGGSQINEVRVVNLGKTNIQVDDMRCEGFADIPRAPKETGALIAPGSYISAIIDKQAENTVIRKGFGMAEASVECFVRVRTLDGKRYSLGYSWVFNLKDNAISTSQPINYSVVEIKQ